MSDTMTNPFFTEAGQEPECPALRSELDRDADSKLQAIAQGRRSKSIMVIGTHKVGKSTALEQLRVKAQNHESVLLTHSLDVLNNERTLTKLEAVFTGMRPLPTTMPEGTQWLWWWLKAICRAQISLAVFLTTFKRLPKPGLLDKLAWFGSELKTLKKCAVILIDDFHKVDENELEMLSDVFNSTERRNLPILFVVAGLPRKPKRAGKVGSELVRAFEVHHLKWLDREQSRLVLEGTAAKHGRKFTGEAVEEIVRLSRGSPYLLQLFGRKAWSKSDTDVITLQNVEDAYPEVKHHMVFLHFEEMWQEMSTEVKEFAVAMASLPSDQRTLKNVTRTLGEKVGAYIAIADELIDTYVIHELGGDMLDFTFPLFDEYILEIWEREN